MLRRLTRRSGPWLAALLWLIPLLLSAVHGPWALLDRLEWLSDDIRLRVLAPEPAAPHPDIAIVDIDEASLQALGRWPWPRQRLAALAEELFARQRVAALGFDMVFAEPDDGHAAALLAQVPAHSPLRPAAQALASTLGGDRPLADALRGRPAVLGWYLSADRGGQRLGPVPPPAATVPGGRPTPGLPHWSGHAANLPLLAEAAPRQGIFNALPDGDGVVRSVAALSRLDDGLHESLALALWRVAVGGPALSVDWRDGPRALELARLRYQGASGERVLLPDLRGALRVPFQGQGGPQQGRFRYLSAARLLAGELPPGRLAGQLVLLGSSAPGLGDLRPTPIHPAMPGVEIHAHLLAGLLDGQLSHRPDWAGAHAALAGTLLLLGATALALALPVPAAMAAMTALAGATVAATLWAEARLGLLLPLTLPLLPAVLQFIGVMAANQVQEWRRRQRVEALFGSYLPPERVRQLVRQPEATPELAEHRELSVLFCDLQGFSGLAERLEPMALRDLLNRFFSTATEVVQAQGGTLDKFIGDAVMAFWGAPLPQPDHAARSVRAAVALHASMGPLNDALRAQGLPEVRFGIGLASGWVCVGDLGSRLRRSYTAVGDAVNVAARLEALTRETGLPVLVSQSTRDLAAPLLPGWLWLQVDSLPIRGRVQVVTVFTPLAPEEGQRSDFEQQLRIWHLALDAAAQHHHGTAAQCLDQLDALVQDQRVAVVPGLPALLQRLRDRLSPTP
ncbi:CHASE2 domain-containing protein [Ideonella alba]|uniref:Adenylate/guanylate cyclase domain-containing protein n=1 Tax=Ideonella alba TaxID=2824118 RepID=A0A941BMU4_9BURK|nr:adenylate/guanylate cyclase domain-containing protein [Ideonella alba]MBQ0932629.1 adenylate/guanylate cyclase domain-containing protein [Ideonella alba]